MRHKCDGVHGVAADLASNDVLDQWLLRNVSTMHHICSTCKMGPESDALAVVDQYGRMHGLTGLRGWVPKSCRIVRAPIRMSSL